MDTPIFGLRHQLLNFSGNRPCLFNTIIVLSIFLLVAQTLDAQLISASGGTGQGGGTEIEWIIGGELSSGGELYQQASTTAGNPEELSLVRIYPNPVSAELKIETTPESQGSVLLEITGIDGKVAVNRFFLSKRVMSVDMKNKPAGIYILRFYYGTGEYPFRVEKIIKN